MFSQNGTCLEMFAKKHRPAEPHIPVYLYAPTYPESISKDLELEPNVGRQLMLDKFACTLDLDT